MKEQEVKLIRAKSATVKIVVTIRMRKLRKRSKGGLVKIVMRAMELPRRIHLLIKRLRTLCQLWGLGNVLIA